MAPSPVIQAIQAAGAKYGIDWRVLAAGAAGESGLNPAIWGDNHTSIGLYQLHIGGALGNISQQQAAAYANPQLNAMTAARQVATQLPQIAKESHTNWRQAIADWVNLYERPRADLRAGEIAKDTAWYQKNVAGANPSPQITSQSTPMQKAAALSPAVHAGAQVQGVPNAGGSTSGLLQYLMSGGLTGSNPAGNLAQLLTQGNVNATAPVSPAAASTTSGNTNPQAASPATGISPYSGPQTKASSVYANPYRDLQQSRPEGTDHGFDYAGNGAIYAIGPGVVTTVNNHSGWVGGHAIAYKITAGPAAGKTVYLAENITSHVKVGQKIDANTVIATTTNHYPYTEMGWAQPGTDTYFNEPRNASAHGRDFTNFLRSLGAKV